MSKKKLSIIAIIMVMLATIVCSVELFLVSQTDELPESIAYDFAIEQSREVESDADDVKSVASNPAKKNVKLLGSKKPTKSDEPFRRDGAFEPVISSGKKDSVDPVANSDMKVPTELLSENENTSVTEASQEPSETEAPKKLSEPEKPSETEAPKKPSKPEKPSETEAPEESSEPETEEKLIIIDTSNWKFEKVETVYDGKEHTALVEGLQDFVVPVYRNNTRTNAGTTTAYVSFEVPEGYAVPKPMETTITITKAVIPSIQLDKMWMLTNLISGTITITPPVSVPKGVLCTYEVNGENVGTSYVIKEAGLYSVIAHFDLTKEMAGNYTLTNTTSKAMYQVSPEQWTSPKYNICLSEVASVSGQKKVEIWFDQLDSSFHTNATQWNISYDYNSLELVSSEKGSSMIMARQNAYTGGTTTYSSQDPGYGYAMGNHYTFSTLLTLTFNVLDENAEDIVINLSDISATSMDDFLSYPTSGTGIVLNQHSNLIGVTLPTPAIKKRLNLVMNSLLSDTRSVSEPNIPEEEEAASTVSEPNVPEEEEATSTVSEPNVPEEEEAASTVSEPNVPEEEESASTVSEPNVPDKEI